ncbi:DsbA family protein [Dankookia rubra]|uniref:DsbA family protein n=1 Tax=Dankookia rubra TaxID=1442381 RepID=A0A4R5QIB3_9PROT|nr:DsbA family protein [Dankookia rubra]TDH63120.1 DsbA family protein [Dankookia rubra]
MARRRIGFALLLLLAAFGQVRPGRAAEAADGGEAIPPLSRQQIEQIVRDFLLREPDILFQAAQIHEQRRKNRPAAELRGTIADARAALTDARAPSIGAPAPKVTLVEFFDFRCVYCRRMAAMLEQIVQENDDIRVVFKDLPILGPVSTTASQAALAARLQQPDRYHVFHQAMMRANDLSGARILGIAGELGLDLDRLRRDMAGPEVRNELDANGALAKALGIAGTPAFILGESLIPSSLSKPDLLRRIEEVRRACETTC